MSVTKYKEYKKRTCLKREPRLKKRSQEINNFLEKRHQELGIKQRYVFGHESIKGRMIYKLDHYTASGLYNKNIVYSENFHDVVEAVAHPDRLNIDISKFYFR